MDLQLCQYKIYILEVACTLVGQGRMTSQPSSSVFSDQLILLYVNVSKAKARDEKNVWVIMT